MNLNTFYPLSMLLNRVDNQINITMRYSGVLLFTLFLSVTGCNFFESEVNLSDKLVGTWEERFIVNEEEGIKVINNYDYKDINTYEFTQSYYDLEDNFLGYRLFREGKYLLEENKLVLKTKQDFRSENEELYPTIEDLKNSGIEGMIESKTEYRTEFSNSGNTVILYFYCPPNASCLAPPVLNRITDSVPVIF